MIEFCLSCEAKKKVPSCKLFLFFNIYIIFFFSLPLIVLETPSVGYTAHRYLDVKDVVENIPARDQECQAVLEIM